MPWYGLVNRLGVQSLQSGIRSRYVGVLEDSKHEGGWLLISMCLLYQEAERQVNSFSQLQAIVVRAFRSRFL